MANNHRTSNGRTVDMDKIRLANEEVIAVGNMKVNARGDQLGTGGQVIATRNQNMNDYYKLHTPIAQAETFQEPIQQTVTEVPQELVYKVNNQVEVPAAPPAPPAGERQTIIVDVGTVHPEQEVEVVKQIQEEFATKTTTTKSKK